MDSALRSSLPHLTRWFNTVLGQKEVKEVMEGLDLKQSLPKMAPVVEYEAESSPGNVYRGAPASVAPAKALGSSEASPSASAAVMEETVTEGVAALQVADEGAGLYTSELRGNDEAGEGTARVPFKTVLRAMLHHGKEPFPQSGWMLKKGATRRKLERSLSLLRKHN